MFPTLLALLAGMAALYLWQNALRARDHARALGHELCRQAGVQLLDQSVSLSGVGFTRNAEGRLRLRRSYAFEISLDGHDRHRGGLQMLDGRLLSWSLPLREHGMAIDTVGGNATGGNNVVPLRPRDPSLTRH